MPTSLLAREAICAYKGQNSPFGIGSQTAYSVGNPVLQRHFEQLSLTLLHRNLRFHQIQLSLMCNQMIYKYLFHFDWLISWTIFIYYFYWSVIYHIELKDQQGKQHLDSTTPSIPCGLEANVTLNNWNKKKIKKQITIQNSNINISVVSKNTQWNLFPIVLVSFSKTKNFIWIVNQARL